MKTINILLILSLFFMAMTCEKEDEDCHKSIEFINNSDGDIYVIWDVEYPDTLSLNNTDSSVLQRKYNKVHEHKTSRKPFYEQSCWEGIIRGERIPADTLMVFVFDSKVIETTPWEDVTNKYMVLKRYDLSLEDLQASDFTITYP
jgi:hypothetical protein